MEKSEYSGLDFFANLLLFDPDRIIIIKIIIIIIALTIFVWHWATYVPEHRG